MLLNLISNARKFQSKGVLVIQAAVEMGSQILINPESSLFNLKKNEGMLTVIVKDEGIGMDQEDACNAFNTFNSSRNVAGNNYKKEQKGIGLSICKKICEGLSGSIKLESEPGKGNTFTFRMKIFDSKEDVASARSSLRFAEIGGTDCRTSSISSSY